MASTDNSTSSTPAAEKRTVDEAFLNRLKNLVERLRLENATLKKSLETERSGIRGLKALHEAAIRNLKTEHKKKEDSLEKQLRVPSKTEKSDDSNSNRLADCKRLTVEIQSLKAANKGLQEKVKVAQAAECARAAELRAQAAKHAALEHAARKDARAQCHKLLEEIKSKERVIMQLKREAARGAQDSAQAQAARVHSILALIPSHNAISDDDDYDSSNEAPLEDVNNDRDSLIDSSEAPSLDSSFENLRLLSDSDNDEIGEANKSLETHVLKQSFPTPAFLKDQKRSLRRRVLNKPFEKNSPLPSPITPLSDTSPVPSPLGTMELLNTSTPLTHIETPTPSPVSPSTSNARTSKFTRSQKNKIQKKSKTIKKKKRIQKKQFVWAWRKNQPFLHKVEKFERVDQEQATKLPSSFALDYFEKFLTNDDTQYIVDQTNLYSTECTSKSINITVEEFKNFLAIKMMMGIIKLPAYTDYWSKKTRVAAVADIMPLKRYQQIRRYIHFNDNTFDDGDRYFKIRPILDRVRSHCLQQEEEHKYSIDEMMIPYKGKKAGNRRQYMQNKPTKWGFKMFVRAGVSGFVYDFVIYGGNDTFERYNLSNEDRSMGMGAMVVMVLCDSIKEKVGAEVYFDNFFTSLELLKKLRDDSGMLCLGTVRPNRLRGAEKLLVCDKELKKRGRGNFCQVVCNKNKLAVTKWLDNKAVHVASNFSDAHPVGKVKRYCKIKKRKVDVDFPSVISEYTSHMGGVDLADMLVALYRTGFRTQRWYMAIFSQLLDICVNNAWLLWRNDHSDSKMRLKAFRLEIYYELLKKNRIVSHSISTEDVPVIRKPVVPRPPESVRFDNVGHWPVFFRCKNCKTGQTNVKCSKCDLNLCMTMKRNCFYTYHQSSH